MLAAVALAVAALPVAPAAVARAASGPAAVAGRHIPVVPVSSGRGVAGGWQRPAAKVRNVVVVGDSLAKEMAPFLQFFTVPRTFTPHVWGGTAPCDWTPKQLGADRSTVVVISFSGNSLTPCMAGADGASVQGQEIVNRYRYDVGELINTAREAGARVLLVGQPLPDPQVGADAVVEGINRVYRDYAAQFPFVSYVDAGAAVETPDGRFADRLPCTRFDPDCDADGLTVVRGDGVHFCPNLDHDPCTVWSSGAFRFGLKVASAVANLRRYE